MDNLTHSLAGILLAEAALAFRREPGRGDPRGLRLAALVTSVAANNFPDADFLYTGITQPRPLGYLLHHRGHTHTLPVALLLGAFTLALVLSVLRWRKVALTGDARLRLWLLALAGPLVHIGMDFTNNYGVHPFWPLDDTWYYGDSVFIVEPWLWVAMLPVLVASAESRIGRALLVIFAAAALVLAWVVALVPWGAALALTLGAALASFVCFRLSRAARVGLGLAGTLAVILTFALASRLAEANVASALRGEPAIQGSERVVLDVVITPAPANPLCASAIVVGTRGGAYFTRKAVAASVPLLLSAERCRVEPSTPAARFEPVAAPSTAAVRWSGEWSAPLAELAELARDNCEVGALLRFLRAPYWLGQGEGLIVGDVRYDRDPRVEFADLATTRRPRRCPAWVPPWTPPRADALAR